MKKAQRDITYDAELLNGLKDPVEAAAFIEAVMDLNDPDALKLAMRKVAQAHGIAEISRRAELGEKTLFRALSLSGNPRLDTVNKVLNAVGLRLTVKPIG